MPAAWAASTRPVPFGTSTARSSTVTETSSDMHGLRGVVSVRVGRSEDPLQRRLPFEGAAPEIDVRLVLVPELVDVAENGDRVRVAQRTETLPEDPVAHREQQVEVGLRAATVLDLLEDLRHPLRSDAARRALPARLVLVELRDANPELHHAAAVVDHDHAGRADRRSALDERIEVQR